MESGAAQSSTVSGSSYVPLGQPATSRSPSASTNGQPTVIGIYGIPGSGKSYFMNRLKDNLNGREFEFFEGSQVIDSIVPGGLKAFKQADDTWKLNWRKMAIKKISKECAASGKVGIVAGHFMFWEEEEHPEFVYTEDDMDIFTHILYLDVSPEIVARRRMDDSLRNRPRVSIPHLGKWQETERGQLRNLCSEHDILFTLVRPRNTPTPEIVLLRDLKLHSEAYNFSRASKSFDEALFNGQNKLETVLVFDADRTLAVEDTGLMFWYKLPQSRRPGQESSPLKALHSGPLGFSYTAFRQVALFYEETTSDQEFDAICTNVADEVRMHPELISLIRRASMEDHVGVVVVTCGVRRIWEKILDKYGLSNKVKVIGGGRLEDGFVITPELKTAMVNRLRDKHGVYVWAFGDSPLDLGMLRVADEAIVVVGEEQNRSRTMDVPLLDAIENKRLKARQVLLPSIASPRLDNGKLPVVKITDPGFIDSVFRRRQRSHGTEVVRPTDSRFGNPPNNAENPSDASSRVVHATGSSAAKLIATTMRDANLSGPPLRDSHRQAGQYLALNYLGDVIGIDEYKIPHVQGGTTTGYRLRDEKMTTIVALMRGGEPMALGVSEVFPLAMFVHAKKAEDLQVGHLEGQHTVILVDSVVNSGKSVMEFWRYIRAVDPTIRIVVVTGVAQAQTLQSGELADELARDLNLSLVALRTSENKYSGKGTTDTGHRLFNTTHLP